ncbi:MAG: ORF6N domain-containing protein [Chloroflexota bacterium]
MAQATETANSLELIVAPAIEKRILVVRGRQVMLDEDLADLYGVETRVLVQQVRRNEKRFPVDFMFQLSAQEFSDLKSQFVISSGSHGGRRKPPLVFTEQGIAMLSGVLGSERAIAVNIEIMRVFVELRRVASSYAAIEKRLEEIERELSGHDEQLTEIFAALRQLISPPARPKRPVGLDCRVQLLAILEAVQTTGPDQWADRHSHSPMKGNLADLH